MIIKTSLSVKRQNFFSETNIQCNNCKSLNYQEMNKVIKESE